MTDVVLGVDIGGTKIALGLVDSHGTLVWEKRVPSHAGEGASLLLERVTRLVQEAVKEQACSRPVLGIGIASPGQIDYARGVVTFATSNLPGWSGSPVASHISQAANLPVLLDNDGNLAALGEARFGAGRGHQNLICITVGTGVGGGIVHQGHLLRGTSGSAGGFGHLSIQPLDGPSCYCGSRGCIEHFASGKAIAAQALRRITNGEKSVLSESLLKGAREVIQAARQGDELAHDVLAQAGHHLGLALVQVINLLNPSCVVISGGVAEAGLLLLGPIREVVYTKALPAARHTFEVKLGELAGNAGVLGAAAMIWDHIRQKTPSSAEALEVNRL